MSNRDCPTCGDPLSVHGVCGSCGYGMPKKRQDPPRMGAAHRPADIPRSWSKQEWLANQKVCAPYIARCKAILVAAEERHRHSAMPHLLSKGALRGIEYDAEAIAEREALQAKDTV